MRGFAVAAILWRLKYNIWYLIMPFYGQLSIEFALFSHRPATCAGIFSPSGHFILSSCQVFRLFQTVHMFRRAAGYAAINLTKKPRLTTPGPTKVNYKTEHKTPILSLKLKDQSIKLFSLPVATYPLPALIFI